MCSIPRVHLFAKKALLGPFAGFLVNSCSIHMQHCIVFFNKMKYSLHLTYAEIRTNKERICSLAKPKCWFSMIIRPSGSDGLQGLTKTASLLFDCPECFNRKLNENVGLSDCCVFGLFKRGGAFRHTASGWAWPWNDWRYDCCCYFVKLVGLKINEIGVLPIEMNHRMEKMSRGSVAEGEFMPLCKVADSLRNRYVVSRDSLVIVEICLSSSTMNSADSGE